MIKLSKFAISGIVLILILVLALVAISESNDLRDLCVSKNGVYISTYHRYVCLKADSVILLD